LHLFIYHKIGFVKLQNTVLFGLQLVSRFVDRKIEGRCEQAILPGLSLIKGIIETSLAGEI